MKKKLEKNKLVKNSIKSRKARSTILAAGSVGIAGLVSYLVVDSSDAQQQETQKAAAFQQESLQGDSSAKQSVYSESASLANPVTEKADFQQNYDNLLASLENTFFDNIGNGDQNGPSLRIREKVFSQSDFAKDANNILLNAIDDSFSDNNSNVFIFTDILKSYFPELSNWSNVNSALFADEVIVDSITESDDKTFMLNAKYRLNLVNGLTFDINFKTKVSIDDNSKDDFQLKIQNNSQYSNSVEYGRSIASYWESIESSVLNANDLKTTSNIPSVFPQTLPSKEELLSWIGLNDEKSANWKFVDINNWVELPNENQEFNNKNWQVTLSFESSTKGVRQDIVVNLHFPQSYKEEIANSFWKQVSENIKTDAKNIIVETIQGEIIDKIISSNADLETLAKLKVDEQIKNYLLQFVQNDDQNEYVSELVLDTSKFDFSWNFNSDDNTFTAHIFAGVNPEKNSFFQEWKEFFPEGFFHEELFTVDYVIPVNFQNISWWSQDNADYFNQFQVNNIDQIDWRIYDNQIIDENHPLWNSFVVNSPLSENEKLDFNWNFLVKVNINSDGSQSVSLIPQIKKENSEEILSFPDQSYRATIDKSQIDDWNDKALQTMLTWDNSHNASQAWLEAFEHGNLNQLNINDWFSFNPALVDDFYSSLIANKDFAVSFGTVLFNENTNQVQQTLQVSVLDESQNILFSREYSINLDRSQIINYAIDKLPDKLTLETFPFDQNNNFDDSATQKMLTEIILQQLSPTMADLLTSGDDWILDTSEITRTILNNNNNLDFSSGQITLNILDQVSFSLNENAFELTKPLQVTFQGPEYQNLFEKLQEFTLLPGNDLKEHDFTNLDDDWNINQLIELNNSELSLDNLAGDFKVENPQLEIKISEDGDNLVGLLTINVNAVVDGITYQFVVTNDFIFSNGSKILDEHAKLSDWIQNGFNHGQAIDTNLPLDLQSTNGKDNFLKMLGDQSTIGDHWDISDLRLTISDDQTQGVVEVLLTSQLDSNESGLVTFNFNFLDQITFNEAEKSLQQEALDYQNLDALTETLIKDYQNVFIRFLDPFDSTDENYLLENSRVDFLNALQLSLKNVDFQGVRNFDDLEITIVSDDQIKITLTQTATILLPSGATKTITTHPSVVVNLPHSLNYYQIENMLGEQKTIDLGLNQQSVVDFYQASQENVQATINTFLQEKQFIYSWPNGVNFEYTLNFDPTSASQSIVLTFTNYLDSSDLSKVETWSYVINFQFENSLVDTILSEYSQPDQYQLLNNEFMPLSNPFSDFSKNELISETNFEQLAVFKDYDLAAITNWKIENSDPANSQEAQVSLSLERKENATHSGLPQSLQIDNVIFRFQYSPNQWLQFLLDVIPNSTTSEVDSLKFDSEEAFIDSWTKNHAELDSKITVTSFEEDQNQSDEFSKSFQVTLEALTTNDANQTAHQQKTVTWNVRLSNTSKEYLQIVSLKAAVNLKTSMQNADYLMWNALSPEVLTIDNLPSNVVVKKVLFKHPESSDSQNAQLLLQFGFVDGSFLFERTIDVKMSATSEYWLMENFLTQSGIPLKGQLEVQNDQDYPTFNSSWNSVDELSDYLLNNTKSSEERTLALNQLVDAYNYQHSQGPALKIDSFTYQYDDINQKNVTVNVIFALGNVVKEVSFEIVYQNSLADFVSQSILPQVEVEVLSEFEDVISRAENLSSHDQLDVLFQELDLDNLVIKLPNADFPVNVSILNYQPPSHDQTQGNLELELTYADHQELQFLKLITVNFTASYNQIKTNWLPVEEKLYEANSENQLVSGDLSNLEIENLKFLLPKDSVFNQPEVSISNLQVTKLPDFFNEDLTYQFQAEASYEGSDPKTVIFTAELDVTSPFFAQQLFNQFSWELQPELLDNEDYDQRTNEQKLPLDENLRDYLLMSDQQWSLFNKYFQVPNDFLVLSLDTFTGEAALEFVPVFKENSLPLEQQIILFQYNKSLSEIAWEHAPDQIESDYLSSEFIWKNDDGTINEEALNNLIEIFDKKGIRKEVLNGPPELVANSLSEVKITQNDENFYMTQSVDLKFTFGNLEKIINFNFYLNPSSPEYWSALLNSDFLEFEIDYSNVENNLRISDLSENDLIIKLSSNGKTVNWFDLSNLGYLEDVINTRNPLEYSVKIQSFPSYNEKTAQVLLTINDSEKLINFDYSFSPNEKALDEAFSNTHPAILPSANFDGVFPNPLLIGKQNTDQSDPIFNSLPENSSLGLDADGKIENLGTFKQWLITNTDLTFDNFELQLENADDQIDINQVFLADAFLLRNDYQADQLLELIFKSGNATHKVIVNLHFQESPYQSNRKNAMENWSDQDVLVNHYFASEDFPLPRLGEIVGYDENNYPIYNLNNSAASDFLINDLASKNYRVIAIDEYAPPSGDSQQGVLTISILDEDPHGSKTVEHLSLEVNFEKSPNQVKTDQLADFHATSEYALQYEFDEFATANDLNDELFQKTIWNNLDEAPKVLTMTLESETSFQQFWKITIQYGNADPKEMYIQGFLNPYTTLFLEQISKNSTLELDSLIISDRVHSVGDLATANILNSLLRFRINVDDANSPMIDSVVNNNQLTIWDKMFVERISIKNMPENDDRQATAEVHFAILDDDNNKTTYTREYSFEYQYSKNDIDLLNYADDIKDYQTSTQEESIILSGLNNEIFLAKIAPNSIGDSNKEQYEWLQKFSNLEELESEWNIPENTQVVNVQYYYDESQSMQRATVVYQKGNSNYPVSVNLTLPFTQSPQQNYLDNLSIDELINATYNYLNQPAYDQFVIPKLTDFELAAEFEIANDGIGQFISPTDDDVFSNVEITIQRSDNPNIKRTVNLPLTFTHSINYYRAKQVYEINNFQLSSYQTGLPTDEELMASNTLFTDAIIDNIISTTIQNNDTTEAYRADVHFGTETVNVYFYRTNNPLQQLLNNELQKYHFEIKDDVLNSLPSDINDIVFSNLKIVDQTDNQTVDQFNNEHFKIVNIDYQAPSDDDRNGEIIITFSYQDEVCQWSKFNAETNSTQTIIGSTDPTSDNYLGDQGWTADISTSYNVSVQENQTVNFQFSQSDNQAALQKYIDSLEEVYGPANSENVIPIDGYAPLWNVDSNNFNEQIEWLLNQTDFLLPSEETNIEINELVYHRVNNSDVATIDFKLTKGMTSEKVSIKLHFATTYNQNKLDNLSIEDLVLKIDEDYLQEPQSNAPNINQFLIANDYKIINYDSNGVHDFVPVVDADSHEASVKLWIASKNDPSAVREIEVPIYFAKSENEVLLDSLKNNNELNSFWQSEQETWPSEESALQKFIVEKMLHLDANSDSPLNNENLVVALPKLLSQEETTLIHSYANKGWSVNISLGNWSREILLWQAENPLKITYDDIFQDSNLKIDETILNNYESQYPVPTVDDLIFSKNGNNFVLPNDVNGQSGKISIKIKETKLPVNNDSTEAQITYEVTLEKKIDGAVQKYHVADLTQNYHYQYSRNQINAKNFFDRLNNLLNLEDGVFRVNQDLFASPPSQLDFENLNQILNSNVDLEQLLNNFDLKAQNLQITYGLQNVRDDSNALQSVHLYINVDDQIFETKMQFAFENSHNQQVLNNLSLEEIFGTSSDQFFTKDYLQVTTDQAPDIANDFQLFNLRYKILDVKDYSAPIINEDSINDGLAWKGKATITVQDQNDSKAVREITITIDFEKVGLDVSDYTSAKSEYVMSGNLVLPNGKTLDLSEYSPLNGLASISKLDFEKDLSENGLLSKYAKVQYIVINTSDGSTVQNWQDFLPKNLSANQKVLARIVSNDNRFIVQNQQQIFVTIVNSLKTTLTLSENFAWPKLDFSGFESQGSFTFEDANSYWRDYGTINQKEITNLENELVYRFDVWRNDQLIYENVLSNEINDLKVNDKIVMHLEEKNSDQTLLLNDDFKNIVNVQNLFIEPEIDLTNLAVNTLDSEGERLLNGQGVLNLLNQWPDQNANWNWKFQVYDSENQLVQDWSAQLPINLENGYQVHINYQTEEGYLLVQTYNDLIYNVNNLIQPIYLPDDLTISTLEFNGYQGSGTFDFGNLAFTSQSDFNYQDQLVVEYQVWDQNNNLKVDWSLSSEINNLNVHDVIKGRLRLMNDVDYLIVNPFTELINLGEVTNLLIHPRIQPLDLSVKTLGINGNASIELESTNDAESDVNPIIDSDHWHWEYQLVNSENQAVISDWTTSLPTNLTNEVTLRIRIIANEFFDLDGTYPILEYQIDNLKIAVNVSELTQPQFNFEGFLQEGSIQSVTDSEGNLYQIPEHAILRYYVATADIEDEELDAALNDRSNWQTWDLNDPTEGPKSLNVNDKVYLDLTVEDKYVLSNEIVFEPIEVKGLAINPDDVRVHYDINDYHGEGTIGILNHQPDEVFDDDEPFESTESELAVEWEVQIIYADGTVSEWLAPEEINDLKNGDTVTVRSKPINDYYSMPAPISNTFTVSGLVEVIDTSDLQITDFNNYLSINGYQQLIDGEVFLTNPHVKKSSGQLLNDLPENLKFVYQYVAKDTPFTGWNNVPKLDSLTDQALHNGDQVRISIAANDSQYFETSDVVFQNFVVQGLSPLPPTNLKPEFKYNNDQNNVGISGQAFGEVQSEVSLSSDFEWEYWVLRLDDDKYQNVDNQLLSNPDYILDNAEWTTKKPAELKNGDIVYYRLHVTNPIHEMKEGNHTYDNQVFRNDYLSGPIVIENLKKMVNVDPTKLQEHEFTFSNYDSESFFANMDDPDSELFELLSHYENEDVAVQIYKNEQLLDNFDGEIKNNDMITIRLVPKNADVVFNVEDDVVLNKNFIVTGLQDVDVTHSNNSHNINIFAKWSLIVLWPIMTIATTFYFAIRSRRKKHKNNKK